MITTKMNGDGVYYGNGSPLFEISEEGHVYLSQSQNLVKKNTRFPPSSKISHFKYDGKQISHGPEC